MLYIKKLGKTNQDANFALSLKGGIWLKMTQHAHQKYFKIFLKIEYHKFLSVFFHTQDSNIKVQYLQSNFFLLIWCEYHQYFLGGIFEPLSPEMKKS